MPKPKIDASVTCDLPFEENDIAPELRRAPITNEERSSLEQSGLSQEGAEGLNKTNLTPVDISVDSESDGCYRILTPPVPSSSTDSEKGHSSEKEKEKRKQKRTVNIKKKTFTTSGQQVPVSTSSGGLPIIDSPADIYSHFLHNTRRNSQDSNTSEADSTGSSVMEGEYIRALTELTQKLLSRDVNMATRLSPHRHRVAHFLDVAEYQTLVDSYSDPFLHEDSADQLDPDISDLPPLTDVEDQSGEGSQLEGQFEVPASAS
ncbi:hypothetical protein ACROYT_G002679 [Oculina patagonica]